MFIENNSILIISRMAFWVFVAALVSTLFAQFALPKICDNQTYYDVTLGMNDTYCDDSKLGKVIDSILAVPARLIPMSAFAVMMALVGTSNLIIGEMSVYVG